MTEAVGAEPLVLGDQGLAVSFQDFYEIEHARLFGALYLVTRDRYEAEDLMQEAFLKVLQRWNVVQGLENPTGYLYRTAMNTVTSRRRRATVAARSAVRRALKQDPFEAAETRSQLGRALETLTSRQRAVVVLIELLGFPTEEAARTLGVTSSTVRVLLARGRQALREAIGTPDG